MPRENRSFPRQHPPSSTHSTPPQSPTCPVHPGEGRQPASSPPLPGVSGKTRVTPGNPASGTLNLDLPPDPQLDSSPIEYPGLPICGWIDATKKTSSGMVGISIHQAEDPRKHPKTLVPPMAGASATLGLQPVLRRFRHHYRRKGSLKHLDDPAGSRRGCHFPENTPKKVTWVSWIHSGQTSERRLVNRQ